MRNPRAWTNRKVEGDLLALVLVVGVEAGLLVRDELVRQGRRGGLRGKQGEQPACEVRQLHGELI